MINESNDVIFPTGTTVLSADFGIGKISSIEKLQADGDDFYVVEYGNVRSKNYFPTKGNTKIRTVSSKKDFEASLKVLKTKVSPQKFDSRKERQDYFERNLNKSTLNEIVVRITELIFMTDITPREKKVIVSMLSTLESEASIVLSMSAEESAKYIADCLIVKI